MRRLLNFVPILAVFIAHFGSGQPAASASCYNGGSLYIICNHVRWPSPESVADSLRSSDEQTRLAALHRMGFADSQVFRDVRSQSDSAPSRVIGKKLVMPDQVQLTYAALGDSDAKQAILAVFISELQITAVSVAVPAAGGWVRIAQASCWCKYDMYDALATFVQLEPAPGPPSRPLSFELVVRASGGGSGVYAQTETRFRVHNGDLTQSFRSPADIVIAMG